MRTVPERNAGHHSAAASGSASSRCAGTATAMPLPAAGRQRCAGNVAYRGSRGPSAQHQSLHLGDHRVAQQRGSRDR